MPFDPSAAARPDSGIFGLDTTADEAAVHVLGVPFDATTSYRRGAAGGPAAILAASHQIDLFDTRTGRPYEAGIHMPPLADEVVRWNAEASEHAQAVIAAGGLDHAPELGERAERVDAIAAELNTWVGARTRATLEAGKLPVLVGGDHAVPFGAVQAVVERHPGVGLLHVDAHADLRPAYEGFTWSHASILHNVVERLDDVGRVLHVGLRDLSEEEHDAIAHSGGRLRAVYDDRWAEARLAGRDLRALVRDELEHLPDEVYVTFDVDGLDPSACARTPARQCPAGCAGTRPCCGSRSSRAPDGASSEPICARWRPTRAANPGRDGTRSSARACSTASSASRWRVAELPAAGRAARVRGA